IAPIPDPVASARAPPSRSASVSSSSRIVGLPHRVEYASGAVAAANSAPWRADSRAHVELAKRGVTIGPGRFGGRPWNARVWSPRRFATKPGHGGFTEIDFETERTRER